MDWLFGLAGCCDGAGCRGGTGTALTREILFLARFEIGLVPTAAGKAETGRRNLLFQTGLTTSRAIDQSRITQLLQGFQRMVAGFTLVFVNRHVFHLDQKFINYGMQRLQKGRDCNVKGWRREPRNSSKNECKAGNLAVYQGICE